MKRQQLPDLLKGLAAFFMVQVHITELFIDDAGRESLFGKISLFCGGPFAAVVFMIVMGYFIAKNKKTPAENIVRGVKIFFLGFLLNIGLNFHLILKVMFGGWQLNFWEYIFGVDILYLAGMSIVILSMLKYFRKGTFWIALLLILSVSGLTGFMNVKLTGIGQNYVLPFIAGNYSWSYFPIFPWLAYPLAGFLFALQEERIRQFVTRRKTISGVTIFLTGLLVLVFSRSAIETTIQLPLYYHHTFTYFIWASGFVLLWILLVQLVSKYASDTRLSQFICWIGKNITLFYVVQWLLIGNVATAIYRTQSIDRFLYYLIGIFALTVLFTFLLGKIKIRIL
ncbi:MAG: acyltransferase family protein [Bacteroidota bacterium]